MRTTTVSEHVYDLGERLDTGFTHATAREIRLKMKSSQMFHIYSDNPKATTKEYDFDVSPCARINAAAYQWALDSASSEARTNFQVLGSVLC